MLTHVFGESRHHTPTLNPCDSLYLMKEAVIHFATAIKKQFRVCKTKVTWEGDLRPCCIISSPLMLRGKMLEYYILIQQHRCACKLAKQHVCNFTFNTQLTISNSYFVFSWFISHVFFLQRSSPVTWWLLGNNAQVVTLLLHISNNLMSDNGS